MDDSKSISIDIDKEIWLRIRRIVKDDPRFDGNVELVTHLVGRGLTDYLHFVS
jgi:hypothetical protein